MDNPIPPQSVKPTPLPGIPEVRAVRRAIAVLRAFGESKTHWTLTEIARLSGLDKGTTRRLLHTLGLTGLVEHDPAAGYSLTLGLLELSARVRRGSDLQTRARPILSQLAERVGGTAFLWIHDHGAGICLDRVCAPNSIITTLIAAGNRIPLNCGAGPRVILAYISEQEREIALAQPQPRRTPQTVTNPVELRQIATHIRERGYEFIADDFIIGLTALGVPIFDFENRFIGAISITNLTNRFEIIEDKPVLLEETQIAARKLSLL